MSFIILDWVIVREAEWDEKLAFLHSVALQVGNRVVRLKANYMLWNNCFEFKVITLDNPRQKVVNDAEDNFKQKK